MRTLCLNLQRDITPLAAENFLVFSPKVHYRSPGLVFMDITSTAKVFGGEMKLLDEALHVSREFFSGAVGAVSDSPWGAQALCVDKPNTISAPTRELQDLDAAPLSRLHQLEGLIAWRSNSEVEDIIDFFHMLGIHRLGEIRRFEVDSFRERWKDTGTLIWKRLHGLDKQVISPLLPTKALHEDLHLDFPVSLLPFLLHCLEKSMKRLLGRLQARGELAQKAIVQLFCEYSDKVHVIELQPALPCRHLQLFMTSLEDKLSEVNLDNPIKHIQIEMVPAPEKVQSLRSFMPRTRPEGKLPPLANPIQQARLTTGFSKRKSQIPLEETWDITSEFENYGSIDDAIEVEGRSFQIKPTYNSALAYAPRFSRLLKKPRRLSKSGLDRFQFLSHQPIEPMDDGWWESSRGRDHYFAISARGEFVWLFYDRIENQYFLRGYFD